MHPTTVILVLCAVFGLAGCGREVQRTYHKPNLDRVQFETDVQELRDVDGVEEVRPEYDAIKRQGTVILILEEDETLPAAKAAAALGYR